MSDYWEAVDAAWTRSTRRPQGPASVRPGPVRGGAFVAAVLLGAAEALEPVRRSPVVVEVEVDGLDRSMPGRVHVRLVPGEPGRSVALLPLS